MNKFSMLTFCTCFTMYINVEFSAIIPVFSVTWSFKNHSNYTDLELQKYFLLYQFKNKKNSGFFDE